MGALAGVTNPAPSATSLSPDHAIAGSALTLEVIGSGFVDGATVRWNGADRPTTIVNTTRLRASIPASDTQTPGTAQVSAFMTAPGGGTSASLPFTIAPRPALSVAATTVNSGEPATVTLVNGLGNANDWLAFAATGAADNAFLWWTYVGAGVTTRTWTVTAPTTAGTYEFRFYPNGGYTRLATSPAVTVPVVDNPVPSVTALSPASAIGGGPGFTLTVSGSGFVSGSTIRWNGVNRTTTFSATQLRAQIPASDIATPGSASVTVFSPAPGGGTSGSLPFAIKTPPVLTVSATTVNPGSPATVTLTNGLGNSNDWLAFAATGASNTSYLQWTYVGANVTTRTWTVNVPATAGAYEFRFFPNGGSTRAATSPTVTVPVVDNPVPSVTALSPASAIGGGPGFTLTVSGSGFVSGSTIRWNGVSRTTTFVSATQLRAQIPASDIATPGSASVTVFSPAPGGGTSGSLPFAIKTPPVLTVSATTVNPGSPATVTLTNGLGNSNDWLAFAATGASNTSYLQWTRRRSQRHDADLDRERSCDRRHLRIQVFSKRRIHARRDQPYRHGAGRRQPCPVGDRAVSSPRRSAEALGSR